MDVSEDSLKSIISDTQKAVRQDESNKKAQEKRKADGSTGVKVSSFFESLLYPTGPTSKKANLDVPNCFPEVHESSLSLPLPSEEVNPSIPNNVQMKIGELVNDFEEEINHKKKEIKQRNKRELNVSSQHKDAMRAKESMWDSKRQTILSSVISSQSFSIVKCQDCFIETTSCVRCLSCRKYLCHSCDLSTHTKQVVCDREICREETLLVPLLQNQFIDFFGEIFIQEVCVPSFVPSSCQYLNVDGQQMGCGKLHTLKRVCGLRNIRVVNAYGSFDMMSTALECSNCGFIRETTADEYVVSRYWPGTPGNECLNLFCEDFLNLWYNLQHNSPSISRNSIIDSLSNLSEERNRVSVAPQINMVNFQLASREYEFQQFLIRDNIKLVENMTCKACGSTPVAGHCDCNMKLYRQLSGGTHGAKPLFENVAFEPNEKIAKFADQINEAIPAVKGNGKCGASTYKAASQSSGKYAGLAETGLASMVCRHGVVYRMANLFKGESYRVILWMLLYAQLNNFMFFCYDVICKFWPFVKKAATKGKENKLGALSRFIGGLPGRVRPFLSRFHGQTHSWPCQVIWFGHWRKGAAATVGEEQEQRFANQSRYTSGTKRMTDANREDHLTKGALHGNARIEKDMVVILPRRLKTAKEKVPLLEKKLNDMLRLRKLSVSDLPAIMKKLFERAKLLNNKNPNANWPVENLQRELEGVSGTMKHIQGREMRAADGCKARNHLRSKLANLKKRSEDLMTLITKQSGIPLTDAHRLSGVFPWQTTGYVSIMEDFLLVDTWNLWLRYLEEIKQTEKEMCSFMDNIQRIILDLTYSINVIKDNGIITPYNLGKAVLQNTEIRRLNNVLADCLLFFNVQTEEEFLKEVDSISDDIIFELEDCLLSRWIQKEDEEQFSNEEFDEDVGADNLYEDGENFEDYETYDNHY